MSDINVGDWVTYSGTKRTVRVTKVTPSGRIKVAVGAAQFRPDGDKWVQRGSPYGRYGYRDSTWLRRATAEEIELAEVAERAEQERVAARKAEAEAFRVRLSAMSWDGVCTETIHQVARALGWEDKR